MAAALGIIVVSALWWLYFDVAAIFGRRRLMQAAGLELHRLALHAYSYLHLPMIAGIVLFALGLKTTVGDVGESSTRCTRSRSAAVPRSISSGTSRFSSERPAESSGGGRRGGRVARSDAGCGRGSGARGARPGERGCALVVAYEAIRHREHRVQVRHPEIAS